MSSKILLSALAAVAAIAIVGATQDPTFEYPAAKHVGFDLPKVSAQTTGPTERISVSFKHATVREVLDWLKNQGVNFVVTDEQLDRDSQVSINVMNQPMDVVMRALADAWGGHWTRQSDMWVFHHGRDVFGVTASSGKPASDDLIPAPPGTLHQSETLFHVFANGQSDPSKPNDLFQRMDKLSTMKEDAFQKALQNKDDSQAWEEFRRAWEQWAREYEKNFQEFEKTFRGKDFQFKFGDEQSKAWAKRSEEMAKGQNNLRFNWSQNGKGFIFDGKDFKPIDEKQAEAMRKQAEDVAKEMRIKFDAKGQGFTFNGKDFKPLDQKQLEEIKKQAADMAKMGVETRKQLGQTSRGYTWDGKTLKQMNDEQVRAALEQARAAEREAKRAGERAQADAVRAARSAHRAQTKGGTVTYRSGPEVGMRTRTHNLKAIYDSLSPVQRQKLGTFGYINYHDLNADQRKLLGVITDESWTITYKTDSVNFTIKSDH